MHVLDGLTKQPMFVPNFFILSQENMTSSRGIVVDMLSLCAKRCVIPPKPSCLSFTFACSCSDLSRGFSTSVAKISECGHPRLTPSFMNNVFQSFPFHL